MLLIDQAPDGTLQLRADWLPAILHEKGVVDQLSRDLLQHMQEHPPLPGQEGLEELHRWVLLWLDARFEDTGIFDYVDGCKYVQPREIRWLR